MSPPHVRLFSTDLDGTLLGDPAAADRFAARWAALPAHSRPLLVYNTGRTIADTRQLVAAGLLPEPDFTIGSVGTELHDSLYNRGAAFAAQFNEGWDLELVEQIVAATPGVKQQPTEFRHPHKSSWTWSRARREQVEALRRRLETAGLRATVVYSCLHFLDVIPARADKGKALQWLCQGLGIALPHVLVAGDTANDSSMFLLPGVRGIVVGNALPELFADLGRLPVFTANSAFADGLIEGLGHFGVIARGSARPFPTLPDRNVSQLKLPA
jgi:sucrose-6F-phosphate phosphohydrolase